MQGEVHERSQRERERQRDRETERQRDRETDRQRDRETERQRDRETERQRDRETERESMYLRHNKPVVSFLGIRWFRVLKKLTAGSARTFGLTQNETPSKLF